MSVQYRFADRKDISLILSFIKGLAAYEEMENQVFVTEDVLEEWIFEKNIAEVLFVMEDGREVGFALYFYIFSTFAGTAGFFIEDLFVLPECRGKGFGKGLIKQLAKIAMERGCGRLEWSCLNWNQSSIDFYLSLGARRMSEWNNYRITGETLVKLGA